MSGDRYPRKLFSQEWDIKPVEVDKGSLGVR